jgi:RimJ/RimL family protein N-acetyltransferase
MKNKIVVKQLAIDDWRDFKEIRLESVRLHNDVLGMSYDVESNKDDSYWKNVLSDIYNGAVFGLYDEEKIIGLTGVFRHRDHVKNTTILCMVYIHEDYRGKDLSDLLFKASIDWSKSQEGITRIWVGHRAGNEASRRANQRHGFVLISTEDMTFGNGETDTHYTYELKV